jgi:hypothetical protein
VFAIAAIAAWSCAAQPRYPYSAESKNFGVSVYAVADKSKFLSAWAGPTPPRFDFMSTAKVGAPLALVLVFWGTTPDPEGNCQVHMDLRIADDQGRVIGEGKAIPVCVNHPPPPKGTLGLGDTIVDLAASGKPGKIQIAVTFTDHVSGDVLSVVLPLPVTQ